MPTVSEIEQALFRLAPKELAMAWDNVGHLEGNPKQSVQRLLVALDVTEAVVSEAEEKGCQLIVSHHPLMNVRWHEKELQSLRPDRYLGHLLRRLVKADIAPRWRKRCAGRGAANRGPRTSAGRCGPSMPHGTFAECYKVIRLCRYGV